MITEKEIDDFVNAIYCSILDSEDKRFRIIDSGDNIIKNEDGSYQIKFHKMIDKKSNIPTKLKSHQFIPVGEVNFTLKLNFEQEFIKYDEDE